MWPGAGRTTGAPPAPALAIDQSERDFGHTPIGDSQLSFPIRNGSDRPALIVGLVEGCGRNCCFSSLHQHHVAVEPGQTLNYACTLKVQRAEPFSAQIVLNVFDGDYRQLVLSVRGVGVPANETSHGKTVP